MYDNLEYNTYYTIDYLDEYFNVHSNDKHYYYAYNKATDKNAQDIDVNSYNENDTSAVLMVVDTATITDGALQTILSGQSSTTGNAILTTTYSDDYGVRGCHYICNCVESIAANTTKSILLDLSVISENKQVFILPFTGQSGNEEVRITFYEDTNYSGGTTKRCININRTSDNVKGFTLTEGATGSTKGDILTEHVAFGSSASFGPFGSSTAGTASGSAPLLLDTTLKYLITFENTGDTATTFECNINIFEIPAS